uniref:Uncharacterized protein n=1 Tax=Panagrolaimus davidi TaxID=227884 RepID=A0A914PSM8_9BILA
MNISSSTVPSTTITAFNPSLNYTIWLYLGEYIVAEIGMLIAIPAYLKILYKYGIRQHKTAVSISLTMTMFMINELIHAITACIQYLYLIILWRHSCCRTSSCVHTTVRIFGIPTSLAYPYMRIFYSGINIFVGIILVIFIQQFKNSTDVSNQNKIVNE